MTTQEQVMEALKKMSPRQRRKYYLINFIFYLMMVLPFLISCVLTVLAVLFIKFQDLRWIAYFTIAAFYLWLDLHVRPAYRYHLYIINRTHKIREENKRIQKEIDAKDEFFRKQFAEISRKIKESEGSSEAEG